jgi:hypothetical protein
MPWQRSHNMFQTLFISLVCASSDSCSHSCRHLLWRPGDLGRPRSHASRKDPNYTVQLLLITLICISLVCASSHSCRHPLWRDLEILEDPAATPRQKVAARLTKIEKSILQGCLDAVGTCAPCLGELLLMLLPCCYIDVSTCYVSCRGWVLLVGIEAADGWAMPMFVCTLFHLCAKKQNRMRVADPWLACVSLAAASRMCMHTVRHCCCCCCCCAVQMPPTRLQHPWQSSLQAKRAVSQKLRGVTRWTSGMHQQDCVHLLIMRRCSVWCVLLAVADDLLMFLLSQISDC